MSKVKIGTIFDVMNGFAFKSSEYVEEGIRIIRITNVQKGYIEDTDPKFYSTSYTTDIKKYLLSDGDLLMSLTGNVGRVGMITSSLLPAALNQRVACLRPKPGSNYNKNYLYHFFNSDFFENLAINHSNGVAQKNMSTEWLKNVEVPKHTIVEQDRIIAHFDLIDQLIIKRTDQIKNLDNLIKSRFNEMFGSHTLFDLLDISNVVDIIDGDRGKNYPKQEELTENGYCLFLNTKNVTEMGFSFDSCQYISEEKDRLLRKGKLQRGDIVLTTRGTVGNLAFYSKDVKFDNLRINSGMVILRPNRDKINELFFIEQFRLQIADIKSRFVSGTAQPQLPISTMKKIVFILPPLPLQEEFARFVEAVDKSKLAVKKSLEELETLKKKLMQDYFG